MMFDRLADQLAQQLRECLQTQTPVVVALDGFGCCGKSTLAQALAARTGGIVLETDDFHQPEGGVIEDDSPLRYRRWRALQAAASALARGEPARYAPIDWDTHRLAAEMEVQPGGTLILDGIGSHALHLPAHALRVFVDGRAASRMQRVAQRDGPQYANWDDYVPVELAYFQWQKPWRTAHLIVLGAELDFSNSREGFVRRIEAQGDANVTRLDLALPRNLDDY